MAREFDEIIDRAGTGSAKWAGHAERGVTAMTVADMDLRAPREVIDAVIERARHGIFGYTEVPGSYYAALSAWCSERFSWPIKKEWVLITPGVIPALYLAVQAYTERGDHVVLQPPVYYPFMHAVTDNERKILFNPLKLADGRYRMDLEGLAEKADERTKLLILSSPHNPVGRVWDEGELRTLVELCIERGITIVSDEIHFDLVMPGHRHTPTASLSDEAARVTVTCTSPSKTFNTAELQVGNVIISEPGLRERFEDVLVRAGLGRPNVLGAVACEAAYSRCGPWAGELVEYIHGNYSLMRGRLAEKLPGVWVAPLEGTYLGWLDLRGFGLGETEMEELLINKARVALTPGSIFGPGGEGFFRMNLAYPRPVVAGAVDRICGALGGL
ncbi:MAG: MalY/PatB family protein [Thermodesulfobacteriota bacterium]